MRCFWPWYSRLIAATRLWANPLFTLLAASVCNSSIVTAPGSLFCGLAIKGLLLLSHNWVHVLPLIGGSFRSRWDSTYATFYTLYNFYSFVKLFLVFFLHFVWYSKLSILLSIHIQVSIHEIHLLLSTEITVNHLYYIITVQVHVQYFRYR